MNSDNSNNQEEEMPKDPRDSEPDAGHDTPTFSVLHYALATKVDGIVDRQTELSQNIASLATEVRTPKPIPWGPLVSMLVGLFAIIGTVGGLVHQSISDKIQHNTLLIADIEKRNHEHITELDARVTKKDDNFMPRAEIEATISLLRDTTKRLEEMQIAQKRLEVEINVSKAEFNAVTQAIHDRQVRNEGFIEEIRKAENINVRINQLYELYKLLQSQTHESLQRDAQLQAQIQRGNGK